MSRSTVYLIPTLLGDESDFERVIPTYNRNILEQINTFVVENEKSARRFIKTVLPHKSQPELKIFLLNKRTSNEELLELSRLLEHESKIGILSEAGLPAVADPGTKLIKIAHSKNCKVVPLVGPSSILLALMASGLNGQNFKFNGYLPIDKMERKKAILQLENESLQTNHSAQIFMETPYRNNQLLNDLIKFCNPNTLLCVACNVTLADECIITDSIKNWKQKKADFHKKPAIFILES